VLIFDRRGVFLRVFQLKDTPDDFLPQYIAIGDDNRVIISNFNKGIRVFEEDGTFVTEISTKQGERDASYGRVSVDSCGNIYAIDHTKNGVRVFDRTGKHIKVVDAMDQRPRFDQATTSVAIGLNGDILASCCLYPMGIIRFRDGEEPQFITKDIGQAFFQMWIPRDLDVDNERGELFVCDDGYCRIQAFDQQSGLFLRSFGWLSSAAPRHSFCPSSICFDSRNRILLSLDAKRGIVEAIDVD